MRLRMNELHTFIKEIFNEDILTVTNKATVVETSEDGWASVDFTSNGELFVHFDHPDEWVPAYLKGQKGCDGALFLLRNGTLSMHLVECKRTLSSNTYKKAQNQLRDTYNTALSILCVLNSKLFATIDYTPSCYICYENLDSLYTRGLIANKNGNTNNLYVSIRKQDIPIIEVRLVNGEGVYNIS